MSAAFALEERPEDAVTAAILHAGGKPEWVAGRAGRVEAITAVLAGVQQTPRRGASTRWSSTLGSCAPP